MIRATGSAAVAVWQDHGVSRGLPLQGSTRRARNAGAAIIGMGILGALILAAPSPAAPDTKRIVGGEEADPADWPYAAALTYLGEQYCGATVIASDAVLTAAHCVAGGGKRRIRVITGRPDLRDRSTGQTIRIEGVFIHPGFDRVGDRDLAVLRLQDETTATPATLPTHEEDDADTEPGDPLRVAGWGSRRRGGARPSMTLRETAQHPVRPRHCSREFRRFTTRTQICTRGDEMAPGTVTTSCYGDSGGPLVFDAPAADLVVGVVSYGGRRCGEGKPTVYSRVAAGLAFIKGKAHIP
jgi:trypsin